jgi:hypothetical protein
MKPKPRGEDKEKPKGIGAEEKGTGASLGEPRYDSRDGGS